VYSNYATSQGFVVEEYKILQSLFVFSRCAVKAFVAACFRTYIIGKHTASAIKVFA
jgi:hypothetical protein